MIAIVSPSVSFLDSLEFLLADRHAARKFRSLQDARAFLDEAEPGTVTLLVDHHPPFADCERLCHGLRTSGRALILLVNESLHPEEVGHLRQHAADVILQKQSRQFVDDLTLALARFCPPRAAEPHAVSP
jgi:hypothetical protein